MNWVWPLINWLGLAISFGLALHIIKREASNVQKWLMLSFVCGFVTIVCNMMEMYATSIEIALTAAKIAYVGKIYMVLFLLMFGVEFAQIKMSKIPCYLLGTIDTLFLALIMTNDYHHLFYLDVRMVEKAAGRLYMVTDKGPLYYVIMAEIFLCILVTVAVVVKGTKRQSTESKGRIVSMIALAVLGAILVGIALCYILETTDPATFVIAALEIIIMVSVKNFGLLDTKQIVQESALETTQEGLILVDENKRLIYANAVARMLFEEIAEDDGKISLESFFQEKEWVFEKDGCHYEARVSEVRGKNGETIQGYIVWFFDMTFLNQYTNEMIRHKEESEQANRAKTNFLTHISHELRTPMNAVVGYAELALREREASNVMQYLKNIKSAAKTLLSMMNEILDIAKIESGKMELTEINYSFDKLVQEIQSMMETQAAKKGLKFHLEVDNFIPKGLIGDRGKVHEVIMNLVSNAIKYTKEGSVSLRIRKLENTRSQVLLQMEVEDTGIGIHEENFEKIFDKFEQFDREKNYNIQGSGLGLSITQYYVQLMEGDITLESEYGKGTKFIVTLWQGIADTVEEETDNSLDSDIKIRSARVLVVDDNDLNCDVAKGILGYIGVKTDIAMSGEECLRLLESENDYALILTDHMMPGMDGVELMHRIRELGGKYERLPIVLLTANALHGVREEMLKEGFDDFLTKPMELGELRKMLIKFLGTEGA